MVFFWGGGESPNSESSVPDVGQSIGLDAFGGEGEDVDSGQDGDGDPDGGGSHGGFGGKPIMLDLDGDGPELVALEESTALYDLDGDGYRERVAWASGDDGFLAYDKDGESDPGELRTLTEADITSISLTSDGVERTMVAVRSRSPLAPSRRAPYVKPAKNRQAEEARWTQSSRAS